MVQLTEARDKFKDMAVDIDPMDSIARVDLAEELFVSCRFTEASKVCNDALNLIPISSAQSARNSSEPVSTERVVAFDDQLIAPVGECDTSDLIVAVLLQCGFELQRSEEWAQCRAFYARRGAMPFAVATLWLRLYLAGGEFEFVRKVLWQLRDTLGEELHRAAATVNSIGGAGGEMARANYLQAMEMLVVQLMLPCGEFGDARSLVSSDPYLGQKEKSQLLEVCDQSSVRSGERSLGAKGGATGANDTEGSRTRQGVRGEVGGHQSNEFASSGNFERQTDDAPDGHQGPVQKFFSVGDWTPEARLQLVIGAGATGLAAYAACRNRHHIWRAARDAAGVAIRTAGDIGAFIVGSS